MGCCGLPRPTTHRMPSMGFVQNKKKKKKKRKKERERERKRKKKTKKAKENKEESMNWH